MELIKGISQTIKVSLPTTSTAVTARVYAEDGTPIGGLITPTFDSGLCSVTVPYNAVVAEGRRKVVIQFEIDDIEFDRAVFFDVVTPYLELYQLKEILETDDEEECWKVERAARTIVNTICGQNFGYAQKTLTFVGDSGIALSMPERIIRLDKMTEDGRSRFDRTYTTNQETFLGDKEFIITGDGWFLKRAVWSSSTWTSVETSNPIVAPRRRTKGYTNDSEYALTGAFGYEAVPDGVQEAMRLLVNDYACGEQMYRDRFLDSIKASDWNLSYNSAAFYKTGNARANLLLSPYIVNRMRII